MTFSEGSLYRILIKGKKPILIRVTQSNAALHLVRVEEVESGKEHLLVDYFDDESTRIEEAIPHTHIVKKKVPE